MNKFVLAVSAMLAMYTAAAPAQEAAGDEWKQTVFVYGMGPAISGDAQIGNVAVNVDASISDVVDNLKFGAMAAYRIENDEWSIMGDITYMNLGQTKRAPRNNVRAYLDVEQITMMGTVGRRITPRLEGLFSLAYFDVSGDVELRVLQQRQTASRSASWVDPLIGFNYNVPVGEKWSYGLRADIGGFGVGSDLSYHLLTAFKRQNTDMFSWYLGYRLLSYDYETGSGRNYQHYDLTQQGPLVGVAFSF